MSVSEGSVQQLLVSRLKSRTGLDHEEANAFFQRGGDSGLVCRNKHRAGKTGWILDSQKVVQTGFGDGFDVTEAGDLEIRDSEPTNLKPVDKELDRWSSQVQVRGHV